jgi:hypothetical protein
MVIFHSFVKVYQRVMCGNMWKLNKENAGKKSGLVLLASWIEHQGSIRCGDIQSNSYTYPKLHSPRQLQPLPMAQGNKNTVEAEKTPHAKGRMYT